MAVAPAQCGGIGRLARPIEIERDEGADLRLKASMRAIARSRNSRGLSSPVTKRPVAATKGCSRTIGRGGAARELSG
jgi:hypothetical protein